ncbi:uncharacterized protein LOC132296229 [Cornus florida]|uniref:uncharacterized protein LOC132296229 n=1 Tax=Cornus florida TaxID=4283 RepID=UPI00289BA402|nr:uncharacterized protein LOC132296229 [Cornus florida]
MPFDDGGDGFQQIKSNQDVVEMFSIFEPFIEVKEIHLYIVASVDDSGKKKTVHEEMDASYEASPFDDHQSNDLPHTDDDDDDDEYREQLFDFVEVDSDYAPIDELVSLCNSSDDDGDTQSPMYLDFIPSRDLGVKPLQVGLRFASAADFRDALRDHVVKAKFDIKFKRNDGDKISAVCKYDCGWRIYASKASNDQCMIIKTFKDEHNNCLWVHKSKQAIAGYLANRYLEQIRLNPTINNGALRKTIAAKLDIDVSKYKVSRAKRRALNIIEGDEAEQYSKMRECGELILRTNPESIAKLCTKPTDGDESVRTFQRIFISYAAMKKGFTDGCRPFLGVDGCFLKGPHGGHLLSTVGCDGNNQMFPVAFAVVEAETK